DALGEGAVEVGRGFAHPGLGAARAGPRQSHPCHGATLRRVLRPRNARLVRLCAVASPVRPKGRHRTCSETRLRRTRDPGSAEAVGGAPPETGGAHRMATAAAAPRDAARAGPADGGSAGAAAPRRATRRLG